MEKELTEAREAQRQAEANLQAAVRDAKAQARAHNRPGPRPPADRRLQPLVSLSDVPRLVSPSIHLCQARTQARTRHVADAGASAPPVAARVHEPRVSTYHTRTADATTPAVNANPPVAARGVDIAQDAARKQELERIREERIRDYYYPPQLQGQVQASAAPRRGAPTVARPQTAVNMDTRYQVASANGEKAVVYHRAERVRQREPSVASGGAPW